MKNLILKEISVTEYTERFNSIRETFSSVDINDCAVDKIIYNQIKKKVE